MTTRRRPPQGAEDALLDITSRMLGTSVGRPCRSPSSVICAFIAIPGMHKSALANSLTTPHEGEQLDDVEVEVLNTDSLKSRGVHISKGWDYWGHVVAAAAPGKLVVADKNLVPSPPNQIRNVLRNLRPTGAATVAIVPTWQGKPVQVPSCPTLPWPVELVALCMLRTLTEEDHDAQEPLDARNSKAATIVIKFACFFKSKSKQALLQMLRDQGFDHVVPVPVIDLGDSSTQFADLPQARKDLLHHLATGLSSFDMQRTSGLEAMWETRARDLLLEPGNREWLESLPLPLRQSKACLLHELNAILHG